MSVNAGTLFEAAGSAEAIEHYTGARMAARTFCDTGVALAPAAPAPPIRGLSKCLNHRAESSARHGRIASPTPDARRPARLPAARRAGRDSGDCLVLSKQVIANQGVFVSARNWAESPRERAPAPDRHPFPRGRRFCPTCDIRATNEATARMPPVPIAFLRACDPPAVRMRRDRAGISADRRDLTRMGGKKVPTGPIMGRKKQRRSATGAPPLRSPEILNEGHGGPRSAAHRFAAARARDRIQEIPVTRRAWRSAPPGAILCGWRCSCAGRLSGPRA
jgi:hypothetical protein